MSKNIILSSFSIVCAGIFFVINDAVINYLAPLNIQFYHFVFYGMPSFISVPLYLIFSGQFKLKMYATNYYIPLLRGLIFAPMPMITFVVLKNISLPEFTTINMSAPIFAAIFSIIFLKEKLNSYILISLLTGLIGVLLVMQPGFDNFNIYFLLALLGAFLITLTTLIVNKYNEVTSSVGYFIYGAFFIHLISIYLFIYDPIKVSFSVFLMITVTSILINTAVFLLVFAFKHSQKHYASIFCLLYLQILWSSILGFVFFGEYLNALSLLGASLIVLSGLISIPGQFKQINEQ
jgi:drug/metabolite transporter (DMT)-like permease